MAKAMEAGARIIQSLSDNLKDPDTVKTESRVLEQAGETFGEIANAYIQHPEKIIDAQMDLLTRQGRLWQNSWQRFMGQDVEPVVPPDPGDRRFKDESWRENPVFDFMRQSYLISADWAKDVVEKAEGVDPHTRKKAGFYTTQLANALSPSNFAFTNPEVLRLTLESNGANLANGLEALAGDIRNGKLKISQTDLAAFKVGQNLASTPGKVIYENRLMQLIQYAPATEQVWQKPLLIIPPWINKFYILDLNEKKSFIRWAVAQGLTVFVVSWANPDEKLRGIRFEDYMKLGILDALDAIKQATGEEKVNAIGYCVGGTLLAATLGYMAAKRDTRVSSATFFTTQVDFADAGDLLVFVDEEQVEAVEETMAEKGYLDGASMANAFNLLRSNDLIWSYVVNNYLKGKQPLPFDLLYWNSDSTRMPAATHSFYLRQCYLYNNLSKGKMELDGVRIDLSKVKIPVYNLAAREDHIAPLKSVFKLGRIFGGKTRLVVSGSGHIAGVINPPAAEKYQYWTNDKDAPDLESWLAGASEHKGSWWPDWFKWLARRSGRKVPARIPGSGKLKTIEDAPGRYVLVRS
ncbi:MAG TPA: class I poly(R)-hydroxyalkanoic acid synthase [Rhizobiales bacterium]|nr:class I poly(R)-hydroxyalkanoic acid synthase [Hyphomicrobiales bacterium]